MPAPEGGFTYANRSLNELRGLSGSVDNNRIAEMQAHFAAVATQVDDVVGQLVSLRSDLPNWWKGPAANAAMSSFDRVISHAQSTHETATGASQALKICSSVVSEQQSAMADVPDLQPPQPTPTTQNPFTAGSPANPATAQTTQYHYESARLRAANIVEGIAAQFVETRAQLSNLAQYIDDSFQPAQSPQGNSMSQVATGAISAPLNIDIGDSHPSLQGYPATGASNELHHAPHYDVTIAQMNPAIEANQVSAIMSGATVESNVLTSESSKPADQYEPIRNPSSPNGKYAATKHFAAEDLNPETSGPKEGIIDSSTPVAGSTEADLNHVPSPLAYPGDPSSLQTETGNSQRGSAKEGSVKREVPAADKVCRGDDGLDRGLANSEPPVRSAPTSRSIADLANGASDVAPCGSSGFGPTSMHTTMSRSIRGRRPEYLKAVKEDWVKDSPILPPGGILEIE